jgi:hypothetical protein
MTGFSVPEFAALSARCIDRLEIAGRATLTPVRLADLSGLTTPPEAAAAVVGFLPSSGLSWAELGTILRYVPEAHVRGLAGQLAAAGLLDGNEAGIAYSTEGRRSAQAVIDLLPAALSELWKVDTHRLDALADLIKPVAALAIADSTSSPNIVNNILRPAESSASFDLWQAIATMRLLAGLAGLNGTGDPT